MGGYVKRKVGFFAKMARKWREKGFLWEKWRENGAKKDFEGCESIPLPPHSYLSNIVSSLSSSLYICIYCYSRGWSGRGGRSA
jgi:hypothetical protein